MDLKNKPFYLSEHQIQWVMETLYHMTTEEKAGQLFCVNFKQGDDEEITYVHQILSPGGCMFRKMPAKNARQLTKKINEMAKIPMLIAANLEKGGDGIVEEGTILGSPMEIAATGDVSMTEKLAEVCAEEAKAVGANWAFAPIIDIDYNFRNPITNTRTFGSDPELVKEMGTAYVKTIQSYGLAASIKHFPGDGRDERDQHLVTSINDLSCEEWDRTYGEVYRSCISAGAMTCMAGHILLPSYSRHFNPDIKDEEILPGSLSKELMINLLREKLGFEGLIITDATTMAGYTLPMSRRLAVPTSIANGADMFLFSKNLKEDYEFMLDGIRSGLITKERLDEAVIRILALKAALHLGEEERESELSLEESEKIIGCSRFIEWSRECADKAITLVKEEKGVLPLSPDKTPRVLFYSIEDEGGYDQYHVNPVGKKFCALLEKQGFEVTIFKPQQASEGRTNPVTDVTEHYDVILYGVNLATKSNQTVVRIEWASPLGANCMHYKNDLPTIFISFENPYHLLDVPRVKTYINTYNSNDRVLEELVKKLTGKSEFKGKSPVDAFCGKWDTHLG